MQQIKRITEKTSNDVRPYVIEQIIQDEPSPYYMVHFNEWNTIEKLEQTNKGVYITLWIARKQVKLFLSNRDIDIEYYD